MSAEPILLDLMNALTDLLKPKPAGYGATALRILGKLGGRNRRYLSKPKEMLSPPKHSSNTNNYQQGASNNENDAYNSMNIENGMTIGFLWDPLQPKCTGSLEMDKFVRLSLTFLQRHIQLPDADDNDTAKHESKTTPIETKKDIKKQLQV